jgi:isocitrate dehydrogenase
MFEAVHGSAPDIACQGIANPSGMLLASVLMLAHLGEGTAAAQIHNAWLRTIEDGYGTRDLNVPYHKSTSEFAKCVIERVGDVPRRLPVVSYADRAIPEITVSEPVSDVVDAHKTMVGVDIFISSRQTPEQLASTMTAVFGDRAKLEMISNRGVAVWPNRMPETNLVDHYRCRITTAKPTPLWVVNLLIGLHSVGLDVIKTENLYNFNGEKGFSAAQGN